MGVYLNSSNGYTLYKNEISKPYFVDKSGMLGELVPLVKEGSNYICITRPRRFGKTIAANMIGAFFARGQDSRPLFGGLKISGMEGYAESINQYHVIHIPFNETPDGCGSYQRYISRINGRLLRDLKYAYPEVEAVQGEAIWDVLYDIYEFAGRERFIFVLDEWDYIFHQDYVTQKEKKEFLGFLTNLLKDKPYVSLAYMTGILPIAKYSSGSELNMFLEFTMAGEERFDDYFGFTETEVDMLYGRYLNLVSRPKVSREGIREWYDGYHIRSGGRVYNPRSVVASLTNNNLGNYWTSSGPYDEISFYVKRNVAEVQADLAFMVSGTPVRAKIQEYAAVSMDLQTREEIFSAMVVYGFLSYCDGYVSIPNKELMGKFGDMLKKEPSLGYINRLARESERMLQATLAGDTETMAQILAYAHNTETPLLSYNNEAELAAVVNLVYLAARDCYRVEREDRAGTGYADFIFYPREEGADSIILELKIGHTPQEAIAQIKEKQYAMRLVGKMGEKRRYPGRILMVGICYDKKSKKHSCKIELFSGFGM